MNSTQFNERINELWSLTKTGKLPRVERFKAVEDLTDEYINARGKRPEPAQLDRLATLCLYEEVTDPFPDKMARDEYPIMSADQAERRDDKEVKLSDVQYGRDKTIGFKTVIYEDEDGVPRKSRKRIYDFNK
jgi:hypothetical protein